MALRFAVSVFCCAGRSTFRSLHFLLHENSGLYFSADVPACTVTDDALSGSEFVTVSVADSHSVSVSVSELEPVLEVI